MDCFSSPPRVGPHFDRAFILKGIAHQNLKILVKGKKESVGEDERPASSLHIFEMFRFHSRTFRLGVTHNFEDSGVDLNSHKRIISLRYVMVSLA